MARVANLRGCALSSLAFGEAKYRPIWPLNTLCDID
jgi:hypothetical protein